MPERIRRGYDAAASKGALLQAAVQLFAAKGYAQVTAREIGEQAGVDPALIARYFGGKAGLYVEVIASAPHRDRAPITDRDFIEYVVRNDTRVGPTSVLYAVAQPFQDPHLQDVARQELHRRLTDPLRAALESQGRPDAQLVAELASAAFVGIILARHSGMYDAIAAANESDLADMVATLLAPAAPAAD